jgi:hypothetical protein
VPGRNPFHKCSWERLAWFSNRPLSGWFSDLLLRVAQLELWAATLNTGRAVWLPGLFNPSAFLTAIMQARGGVCAWGCWWGCVGKHKCAHAGRPVCALRCAVLEARGVWAHSEGAVPVHFAAPWCAVPFCFIIQVTARRKKYPLDSMTVETHVTVWKSPDAIDVRRTRSCDIWAPPGCFSPLFPSGLAVVGCGGGVGGDAAAGRLAAWRWKQLARDARCLLPQSARVWVGVVGRPRETVSGRVYAGGGHRWRLRPRPPA